MAKAKPKPSTAMTLNGASTPAERETANRTHHQEIVGHLLDSALYGGHGHAVGRQGAKGHEMVASDAHLQGDHAYIPQAVFSRDSVPQNRRNQTSKAGSPFDDPDAANYGSVDDKSD